MYFSVNYDDGIHKPKRKKWGEFELKLFAVIIFLRKISPLSLPRSSRNDEC